ncbi:MAG: hydrogenase expression/formation protein HypE [Myxococcaceae bacterium]|nr:hydrogenase expression/formation protein HypE [Myxococcaceae bacterium]
MSSDAPGLLGAACPVPITETDQVLMGHGSGGKLSAQLVETLLLPAFRNPALAALDDAAQVSVGGTTVAMTTDSFVVTPLFFPGGDIGELAVNGTVNDLAVSGARPLFLSLALILEEGFALAELRRVIESIQRAAAEAGVQVVTGDTKVVNRGKGDKLFINTTGIGQPIPGVSLSSANVRPGDQILVSGTIGDHGVAILSTREGLSFSGGELRSDTAPLATLVEAMLAATPGIHAMRDPTRGGVAATVVEIAARQRLGIEIDEAALPINDAVRGACEMLGLDPLLVANEGKLVAFVPRAECDRALAAMRAHPLGRHAARIGEVVAEHPGRVVMQTLIGGRRFVDLPFAEPLPRIC